MEVSALQAVAEATAAVFVAGRRAGSAVLVDGRHLRTAAHVLRRADQSGGARMVDGVELVFPMVVTQGGEAKASARRVPAHAGDASPDAAVLDLGSTPRHWLTRPVRLSAARRLPSQVSVFGFPSGEGALRGVWREFDVSGPAAGGTVQLD
jgi:hypothetical protein